jgi:hypothetical protein
VVLRYSLLSGFVGALAVAAAARLVVSPKCTDMNFKRPCWLALYTTLGMTLLGYFGYLDTASYWTDKQGGDRWWWTLIGLTICLLAIVGAFGVVVSLIWCLREAITGGPVRMNDKELFRKLLDEHRRGQG